jgi:hypothetical protein
MAEVKVTKETLPEFLESHVSPIVGKMVAESMKEAASKVKDEVLAGINKSQGSPINDLIDKSKQVDSDEIPLEEKGFAITRAARALAFAWLLPMAISRRQPMWPRSITRTTRQPSWRQSSCGPRSGRLLKRLETSTLVGR